MRPLEEEISGPALYSRIFNQPGLVKVWKDLNAYRRKDNRKHTLQNSYGY